MNDKIFIYAEHTANTPANSGVQRVVRGLGSGLIERGQTSTFFVGWSDEYLALRLLNKSEMEHLSKFGGPSYTTDPHCDLPIHLSQVTSNSLAGAWLIIPEVTTLTVSGPQVTYEIITYAKRMGMKVAAVVYDLIPLKLAEYYAGKEEHSRYLQNLLLVDHLLPISSFAKDDLEHFYKNVDPRLKSRMPLITPVNLPYQISNSDRQYYPDPGNEGLILSVGTVEPRKNQLSLIEAFIKFKAQNPEVNNRLAIVGNVHPSMHERVNELVGERDDIDLLNYVDDRELDKLYANTIFTVFPSTEEGFGLPIAESYWKGIPCVSANFGSMAEIFSHDSQTKINVRSVEAICEKITELALDHKLRTKLRDEIKSTQLDGWSDYTKSVCNCLNGAPGLSRIFAYVDSTTKHPSNSGVQRVARRVTAQLEDQGVAVDYLCWDREKSDFRDINAEEMKHLSKWNGPEGTRRLGYFSNNCVGDWLLVPELVLPDPNAEMIINAAKAKGMKIAFVFFDLIPVTLKEHYSSEAQEGYRQYFNMLSKADLLIPLIESGSHELFDYFCRNLPRLNNVKNRIVSVELPGEFGKQVRCNEKKYRSAINKEFKILCVGTLEPRKNHLALIHGVRVAQDYLQNIGSDIKIYLTLAGSSKSYPDYADGVISEIERTANAIFIEAPDDDTLNNLYANHDITAFLSLLEGFGLPVLESLWHGLPCLASNNGAVGELSSAGGCVSTDPRDGNSVGKEIAHMATDFEFYNRLVDELVERPIRTWRDYCIDLSWLLSGRNDDKLKYISGIAPAIGPNVDFNHNHGPLLSIVVSTYNRASWLKRSLPLIVESAKMCPDDIEVIVVDNASTDLTEEVVDEYQSLAFFEYVKNKNNVGMLGNLSICSRVANGKFVWVIGDDDLIKVGAVPKIVETIKAHPRSEIIYLNYSYTRFDEPDELDDVQHVMDTSHLIAPETRSHFSEEIRTFSGLNENLYTAIYACVFRRDHAIAAYTQDTSGVPFSSLLTCIPTSDYVLKNMYNRPGYWIGDSYLVVNMNVSWLRWALIWHLERMPDLFDLAEIKGVDAGQLENYRRNHCADPVTWIRHVYFGEDEILRSLFSIERFIERCKHLPEFNQNIKSLFDLYTHAYLEERLTADAISPRKLLEKFNLFDMIAS